MRKKLVRDFIPEHLQKQGKSPYFYEAEREEYQIRLREKLQEEVDELLASAQIEEFADVIEVLKALAKECNYDWHAIEQCRLKKQRDRGSFFKRYILEY